MVSPASIVISLDLSPFINRKVDYLKIDVESAESDVIFEIRKKLQGYIECSIPDIPLYSHCRYITWDKENKKPNLSRKLNLEDMTIVTSKNHRNQILQNLIKKVNFKKVIVMGSIGCKIASILRGDLNRLQFLL